MIYDQKFLEKSVVLWTNQRGQGGLARQCMYEGRRAESGRAIHGALELDAQKSGKKERVGMRGTFAS